MTLFPTPDHMPSYGLLPVKYNDMNKCDINQKNKVTFTHSYENVKFKKNDWQVVVD